METSSRPILLIFYLEIVESYNFLLNNFLSIFLGRHDGAGQRQIFGRHNVKERRQKSKRRIR